ncbi:PREDICTED: uncharacterized protein PB18E9.04c-like [Calidris pugnax]|uniref:uncharacterized protein PB18E9.04c-like n=1 Tax=Calidris pugnax TaxID=198806 RepID=UPI00071E18F3|nr:PREDICTED: uncharacterized protein PB18E9.04c-like [Calidris pugnax]
MSPARPTGRAGDIVGVPAPGKEGTVPAGASPPCPREPGNGPGHLQLAFGINTTDMAVGMSPALPTSNSTTAGTIPPSRPETPSPAVKMGASTVSTTLQEKGGTAHSTPGSAAGTTVQPDPTPTELRLTTVTPAAIPKTPDCAETTLVTSVGTSSALATTSFGIKARTLSSPTSILLSPTQVATTHGTSQRPAVTTLLSSTSPGTGSASSLTATSDEPSTTPSDTTAALTTSMEATGSTPITSQPNGTTTSTSPGTTALDVTETVSLAFPTSLTSMETSSVVSTTDSSTTGTIPPSSPETGASTLETSLGTDRSSPPIASSPTAPASPDTSAESSMTTGDTTGTSDTSTGYSTPSQPVETTFGITSGTSTVTMETTPGTSTVPETSSAATGTEPSSPTTNSTQTTDDTLSTPTDLTTTAFCPTTASSTGPSYLFLSLQLTVPKDLGNTTMQELLLSKLREELQTTFPCAGLGVEWRGERRT